MSFDLDTYLFRKGRAMQIFWEAAFKHCDNIIENRLPDLADDNYVRGFYSLKLLFNAKNRDIPSNTFDRRIEKLANTSPQRFNEIYKILEETVTNFKSFSPGLHLSLFMQPENLNGLRIEIYQFIHSVDIGKRKASISYGPSFVDTATIPMRILGPVKLYQSDAIIEKGDPNPAVLFNEPLEDTGIYLAQVDIGPYQHAVRFEIADDQGILRMQKPGTAPAP